MNNRFIVLSGAVGLLAVASMMTAPDAHAVFMSASVDYYNGSKYELFYDQNNVSWDDAQTYAMSTGGNLVSITSSFEEAVVESLWTSLTSTDYDKIFNNDVYPCCDLGVWTAGKSDVQGGDWYWATGEGAYSEWDGTALPGMYTNWHGGHPDNAASELYMGFLVTLSDGITGWDNHIGDGSQGIRSFVVETRVPEPSTLALLSLGLAGLGFTGRRRKA